MAALYVPTYQFDFWISYFLIFQKKKRKKEKLYYAVCAAAALGWRAGAE